MITNRFTSVVDSPASPSDEAYRRKREFAQALLAGLQGDSKSIPCQYLYDARGSELFEHITKLPEYYLTRTEIGILEAAANEFVGEEESNVALVEFGSGSSAKTELVLEKLTPRIANYIAIEISHAALAEAMQRIASRFPTIETMGIVEDFHLQASLPQRLSKQPILGFFPGSTIGNCSREEAEVLLSKMRATLGKHSRLIIGTDLVKSPEILLPAYNDSVGVTAEFSLNLLDRANRELGCDFEVSAFRHLAEWNEAEKRVEIYLVSQAAQEVYICGNRFDFAAGERIHIENSHKYQVEDFIELAESAGWHCQQTWTDERAWFAVHELVAADQ